MMEDADPIPFWWVGQDIWVAESGGVWRGGGRLIVRLRSRSRWDDSQEDEGLKKKAADMDKESSSGLGGKNVAKNNDLGLRKCVNSEVSLKGTQKAE